MCIPIDTKYGEHPKRNQDEIYVNVNDVQTWLWKYIHDEEDKGAVFKVQKIINHLGQAKRYSKMCYDIIDDD